MSFGGGGSGGGDLSGLGDVALSNPQDAQILSYDAAAAKWENQSIPSGGSVDLSILGIVPLDSFSGTDDDAKMAAALSYIADQTYKPTWY